ncbi:MAG: signal recognition particle-docking protein FtsY [Candidatus Diapherotrites archaeon]|nr:signal recognition particle-docking protein FtsY [Candidatus Diapherotrites archaeon]
MFDLLKKKLASFTQKISGALEKKEQPGPAQEKTAAQKTVSEEAPGKEALGKETPPAEEKTFPQETEQPQVEPRLQKQAVVEETARVEAEEKRKLAPKIGAAKKIVSVFTGKVRISENELKPFVEELELALLEADVEQNTATHICTKLGEKIVQREFGGQKVKEQLRELVKETLEETMKCRTIDLLGKAREKKPLIILFLGPNGAGKTTTIAKLAAFFKKNGFSAVFAAGDTFRAASIEQLKKHGEKTGTRTVSHAYGADPTAVAFDAVKAAQANSIDVVLIDSAGRQETNKNLIEELKKINRVIKPDLKIFVGESLSGQAILSQAREFDKEIGLDGFILTKMDADSKGGTAVSLIFNLKKPVIFMGTGQEYGNLEEFRAGKIIERIV